MGQCQCTDPFSWTDQPEPRTPVPSEGRFQAAPGARWRGHLFENHCVLFVCVVVVVVVVLTMV